MLIFDFEIIGNKLYEIRKKAGMTQAEVAEAAGLSDRGADLQTTQKKGTEKEYGRGKRDCSA